MSDPATNLRGAKLNASANDDLDQVLEEGAREIERLRANQNRTIEFIADLERHGTIDHAVSFELIIRLGGEPQH